MIRLKVNVRSGDRLVAIGGTRRVDVVAGGNGVLMAVPVMSADGMEPMPLTRWLGCLTNGAEKIGEVPT